MAFDKIRVSGTVGASGTLTVPLPWTVSELIGFRATAVGDTTARINIADADGRVAFADAGDIDYTTTKDTVIGTDATVPTSGWTAKDSTGAVATIAMATSPLLKDRAIITWSNGTAGDTLTIDLYVRGPVYKQTATLTVPNPAATTTTTVQLRSKYAQIVGLSNLLTGTDTTVQLKVTDADSRVIFQDAADKDYKTARINVLVGYDDTLSNLTPQQLDATGVAATATSPSVLPVAKSPLTLTLTNGGTAGDVLSTDIYYRAG